VTELDDQAVRGLRDDEVQGRALAGQSNRAPASLGRTIGQIVRANVFTRFNAILGSLFLVVLIVGPIQDGLFGFVLAANTSIGIFQEIRTKRELERLAILTAPRARVVRNAMSQEIAVEEVVVDDVVSLRAGDQVVVDAVVLDAEGLEVDESLLTGEAEPVEKTMGDDVLSGSFVSTGSAKVRATAVGTSAYAVRVEEQARRFSLLRSELQQGTNQILRLVTWIMIPVGIALVASELLRTSESFVDALRGSVAGVGAMVPEGLVLLTSIAFALGALRLARERVLVQELAAIEGLARVDVLCIDKTGTLTEPGIVLDEAEAVDAFPQSSVEEVLAAIAHADSAPNATMRAILARYGLAPGWIQESAVPFSSARKWSAVCFRNHGTWVLGAPDVVAADLGGRLAAKVAGLERSGHRVVVLLEADRQIAAGTPRLPADLRPCALLSFAERLRPEAASTTKYLLEQGLMVKVLSGDAPATVSAIAAQAGVPLAEDARSAIDMHGHEFAKAVASPSSGIFGRVRPDQKLDAVKALQAAGHVVAMVGDGVNDVQALKQADLGIAMGSGSQSSRSVARIVLLDDNFGAVPSILDEGRRVIANIERVANLFVTKTAYAALLALIIVVSGLPYPFFPRHMTIVTTFTIGVPGFFLALAKEAPRAVSGFVRRVLCFTAPAGSVAAGSTFVAYSIARATSGITETQARTAALLALLGIGFWVLILVARPLNLWRGGLVLVMIAGVAFLFTVPKLREIFDLQAPPTSVVLLAIVCVFAGVLILSAVRAWVPFVQPAYWEARLGRKPGATTRTGEAG
jgi:cation-transporting P-type ATPase E